jgi:hypothetical protein
VQSWESYPELSRAVARAWCVDRVVGERRPCRHQCAQALFGDQNAARGVALMPRDDPGHVAVANARGAGLVLVDVPFGGVCRAGAHQHLAPGDGVGAQSRPHVDAVAVANAPPFRIARCKVQVTRGDDHATRHVDASGRTDERNAPDGTFERPTMGHRCNDPKMVRIAARELKLRLAPRWSNDAQRFQPTARPNDVDHLSGRDLTGLPDGALHAQLVGADQPARVVRRDVEVPARNSDWNVDLPTVGTTRRRRRRASLPDSRVRPGRVRWTGGCPAHRRPSRCCRQHVGGKRGGVDAMRRRQRSADRGHVA